MPADFSNLQTAIDDLVAQATKTTTTEGSAKLLIISLASQITTAVTAALTADRAANQTSIDAATTAIKTVKDQYLASADDLGAAIVANTPPPPPAPPA
jgi:hypothetical protein